MASKPSKISFEEISSLPGCPVEKLVTAEGGESSIRNPSVSYGWCVLGIPSKESVSLRTPRTPAVGHGDSWNSLPQRLPWNLLPERRMLGSHLQISCGTTFVFHGRDSWWAFRAQALRGLGNLLQQILQDGCPII